MGRACEAELQTEDCCLTEQERRRSARLSGFLLYPGYLLRLLAGRMTNISALARIQASHQLLKDVDALVHRYVAPLLHLFDLIAE